MIATHDIIPGLIAEVVSIAYETSEEPSLKIQAQVKILERIYFEEKKIKLNELDQLKAYGVEQETIDYFREKNKHLLIMDEVLE